MDKNKRGKLIAVSLLVTFFIVISKFIQQEEIVNFYKVLLNGLSIGAISYLGLLWALNFQATLRSLVFVITQSAFFVVILNIFTEVFVFRRVGRVYEAIILFIVSIILFFIIYASFLMANIFNVAHFKEIPLVQVAKTTSLLLTLLSIYFITFAVLEAGLYWYVTILLLALTYHLLFLFHFRHLGIQRDLFWRKYFATTLFSLLYAFLFIIIGGKPLVYAILPSVVSYCLIAYQTMESSIFEKKFEFYILTLAVVILVIFVVI